MRFIPKQKHLSKIKKDFKNFKAKYNVNVKVMFNCPNFENQYFIQMTDNRLCLYFKYIPSVHFYNMRYDNEFNIAYYDDKKWSIEEIEKYVKELKLNRDIIKLTKWIELVEYIQVEYNIQLHGSFINYGDYKIEIIKIIGTTNMLHDIFAARTIKNRVYIFSYRQHFCLTSSYVGDFQSYNYRDGILRTMQRILANMTKFDNNERNAVMNFIEDAKQTRDMEFLENIDYLMNKWKHDKRMLSFNI